MTKLLALALLLVTLLGVQFAKGKDLCKEDPNYEIAQTQLKTIENDFHNAKLKAELRIGNLKKTGGAELELLEKEYNNFVRNYTALMHLIEEKPAFCEKVIQELRYSIDYFTQHFLLESVTPTKRTNYY